MPIEPSVWLALADGVLLVHTAYVVFVVGGQLLIVAGWVRGWRWTQRFVFRLLHLLAIGLVMLEAWIGAVCPLTVLENFLRSKSGDIVYTPSFISHRLERLIFSSAPGWLFTLVYTSFTVMVVLTWLAYPPRQQLSDTLVHRSDAE